jgi:3-methyladenine DNA glycosylase AlkD
MEEMLTMPTANAFLNFDPQILSKYADPKKAAVHRGFFKDSKDFFFGIPKKTLRTIARDYAGLPLQKVLELMRSTVHEEKSLANEILCLKFKKGDEVERKEIFDFYIKNRKWIRDWDAVDDTAPYIVGPSLLNHDQALLYTLARSKRIWDRRIAIVSTLYLIRNGVIAPTLRIAQMLLKDHEDLIHKATGWMLREVGKRDRPALEEFLAKHHSTMPRTMLRYAIERFPKSERLHYLRKPAKK